jgi:hypothetical protein
LSGGNERLMRHVWMVGTKYFDGQSKDYDYIRRNCGDYVEELVKLLKVEHGSLDYIVHAPPMKRFERPFLG